MEYCLSIYAELGYDCQIHSFESDYFTLDIENISIDKKITFFEWFFFISISIFHLFTIYGDFCARRNNIVAIYKLFLLNALFINRKKKKIP